jgi:hypothetical protein
VDHIVDVLHLDRHGHAPPDPFRLAQALGVRVRRQTMLPDIEVITLPETVYYRPSGDQRADGLVIATGLARVALPRYVRTHTEAHVAALAGRLLVPGWLIRGALADLEEAHVWAPRSLIRARWRAIHGIDAVA